MAEATVVEVLRRAADLIENAPILAKGTFWAPHTSLNPHTGWRITMHDDGDNPADCFCAMGAIDRALSEYSSPYRSSSYQPVMDLLGVTDTYGIADWNDELGRTKAEVVEVLRAAAERASNEVPEPAGQ